MLVSVLALTGAVSVLGWRVYQLQRHLICVTDELIALQRRVIKLEVEHGEA
jgi:hypothetical protein